jgi:hypothetical protein
VKTINFVGLVSVTALLSLSLAGCGGDSKQLAAENAALHAELAELKARAGEADAARQNDAKRAQTESQDVARLRGEVTQLRTAVREVTQLRAENQKLRTENQTLKGAAATAAAPPAAPTPPPAGSFPKESWSFAGYGSPESALVSAIWSMQQGNAKQYFESLTQDEQLRMAKSWEGKTPEEISAKHQADTAAITGLKVLQNEAGADGTALIKVLIEGPNREEVVRMQKVGNDWKFGGFIREAGK